jgi:succinyl-CoA synthetase beta subunit
MARILEHQAKQLFREAGIAVPDGHMAVSPDEAAMFAEGIGNPVVVKALVPVGKRGMVGGVRFADDSQAARDCARDLIGQYVGHYLVDRVLVEQRIDYSRELYISILNDRDAHTPRLIISTTGGVDIETSARAHPETMVSEPLSFAQGIPEYYARSLWSDAGITGPVLPRLGMLTNILWNLYLRLDARMIEINPLFVTTNGRLIAGDAVISVDPNAMFRHPELSRLIVPGSESAWRPMTELEARADAVHQAESYRGSARYLELEGGDIGFLCGGGGASLLLFDNLVAAGGQPANYAEIGGNPTEAKVAGMTSIVVSKPGVRALFVAHNITNNTQVDVIARGVVEGLHRAGKRPPEFPVLAREAGLHDEEGQEIFTAAGITYLGEETTLSRAAVEMVSLLNCRGGS